MKSNLIIELFTEDEFNYSLNPNYNVDQQHLIKLKNMAFAAPIIQDLNTKLMLK